MSRVLLFILAFSLFTLSTSAQDKSVVLSTKMFRSHQRIFLAPLDGWVFKKGHDPSWANPALNTNDWESRNITSLTTEMEDNNGRLEGWFRIKIKLAETFEGIPLYLNRNLWAATAIYLDGQLVHSFGDTGEDYEAYNPILKYPIPINMVVGKEYLLAVHFVDYESTFTQREIRLNKHNLQPFLNLAGPEFYSWVVRDHKQTHIYVTLCFGVSFLLFFLYWFLVYLNPDQTIFRIIAWYTTIVLLGTVVIFGNTFYEISYSLEKIRFLFFISFQAIMTIFGLFILEWVLTKRITWQSWGILTILLIVNVPAHIFSISLPFAIAFIFMLLHFGRKLYSHRSEITGAKWAIVAAVVVPTLTIIIQILLHKYSLDLYNDYEKQLLSLHILSPPLFYLAFISVRFKETLQAVREESEKHLKVTEEKRAILTNQNVELEKQVNERTKDLNDSLKHLKATQTQLIQQEKLASLGQLTAGIAHEIKNPLNFVNNFSDLSLELLEESRKELSQLSNQLSAKDQGRIKEAQEILNDVEDNLKKIYKHGTRADAIVKSMLQHSRGGSGIMQDSNLNAIIEEYANLAFHGMRAGKKPINVTIKKELDPNITKVSLIEEDFTRVILNLFNNAFDAMKETESIRPPVLTVRTLQNENNISIEIEDNGSGIPDEIKDKVLQPFFTTKKGTEGTGLGLSITHDIIKAHGGQLSIKSVTDGGSIFTIQLPIKQ